MDYADYHRCKPRGETLRFTLEDNGSGRTNMCGQTKRIGQLQSNKTYMHEKRGGENRRSNHERKNAALILA